MQATNKLERRSGLSQDEFINSYVSRSRPVVVQDAIARWTESESDERLSERFFLESFASFDVQVYDDLFDLMSVHPLRQYIDRYWNQAAEKFVPYVRWYAKFRDVDFVWADDAFAVLEPHWSMPYFLPSSGYELPRCQPPAVTTVSRDGFPAKGIFISAAGARTRLHRDPWCSDAILCQLTGRKKLVMYAPSAAPDLCKDELVVDIDSPDLGSFPGFPNRRPDVEDYINPGDTLYIPTGWFHHVVTVTNSISLTWNFVLTVNAWRFLDYKNGELCAFDREVLRYFNAD